MLDGGVGGHGDDHGALGQERQRRPDQLDWRLDVDLPQPPADRRLGALFEEFTSRGPDADGEAYSLVSVLHPDLNPPAA